MNKQLWGAALVFPMGLTFIALELLLHLQTALAGVFVVGMAAGLLLGDRMARTRPSAS
jgi:hypothetical protein